MEEKKMKFFYLKLGKGNCLAEYWLGNNIFNTPAAAIYFETSTAEDIRKEDGSGDKANFVKAPENKEERVFITFSPDKGCIYFYVPTGEPVFDMPKDKYEAYNESLDEYANSNKELKGKIEESKIEIEKNGNALNHFPKVMEVEMRTEQPLKIADAPHVLATLSCDRSLSRHTCREIKDWGAIQAIKHCLNQSPDEPNSASKLMYLLSPLELETLVFLILKNAGLFVPAWRGGTLKDIDIIAKNLSDKPIKVDDIEFEPKKSKSFQVKRKEIKNSNSTAYYYTIAIEGTKLNACWLLKQIYSPSQEETRKWFENSLNWYPGIKDKIEKISKKREG